MPRFMKPFSRNLFVAIILAAIFSASIPSAALAQKSNGISKEERARLVEYLREIRQSYLDETVGLSEKQINFKPNIMTWSISQITEHLVLVENYVYPLITETIVKSPPRPELKGEKGPRMKDMAVRLAASNRSAVKLRAPEFIRPKNLPAPKAEKIGDFEKVTARTIGYAETTQEDLRSHFSEHAVLGMIDAYQWLLFIGAHIERHLGQLKEVKAHPRFPRSDGGLTKEERDFLCQYMMETQQNYFKEVSDLSEAQLRFKPDAGSWSIAEIAEHLAKAEDVIYKLVTETIMKSPSQPELKGKKGPRINDRAIIAVMTNRKAQKFEAPGPIRPTGQSATKAASLNSFAKSRARNTDYIRTTKDDLRSHFRENGIGVIDGLQWLIVLAAHTERHREQILEVKGHRSFPKH